ncbi:MULTISPECIES: M23 family metallopeptidase [unclassified Mesorhizobium]|uniref:M23 family metallopeptidase n=1 Tax=unclassified Mesorhizobium TaxID=325217 RepID=UPI0015E39C33|nr:MULTISPECIES: M23 family metallopeptidase [unclassified Mesorhizobium]MBZ9917878.1 M23 family metallopeptidase [Mesorhizobium sp. BR1-1-7]MBZ9954752.1 M23 family metallopeptidase [Mesorhizobium sp. BR1-1-15]MBZ9961321.1 M23 family metallopeptidase [Mesorhizobium sp. BR1-1-14]MBZ9972671.1 M23 family metallopeptidase [Mesorhizobium sp. BR1-1-12]MBZ9984146.1 M23 family metallopeptidase [Mesorhizobium sp. BR-1-1-8]
MPDTEDVIAELGNEPPLIADGRSGPPDRREVSARWLSGTFLTGVTSSVLMGVALFAALDGRQQLATPPEIAELIGLAGNGDSGEMAKTTRLVAPRQIAKAKDRRRMEVSMVTKVGDRDVIHTMPFVQIKMALAAGHTTNRPYPPFDPMQVFGDDGDDASAQPATAAAAPGQIYGTKVESEMSLKTVDFPIETASFDEKSDLSADEVEKVVREAGTDLSDGAVQVASLHYVDPQRFGEAFAESMAGSYDVRIVPENVSVAPRANADDQAPAFAEEIIPFTKDLAITEAFADSGYTGEDAAGMAEAITKLLNAPALKAGTVLRVGLEVHGDAAKVVRTSVYDRTQHIVTIALDDRGQYVPAQEPEPNPELLTAFDDSSAPVVVRGNLPNVYDGIYRAAYSYGMSKAMTQRLIKLLASDVDFQSRLNPADRLEVLFSQPDGDDQTSDNSELLYVSATFGGQTRNFYRFQMQDGSTDYFDEDGSSAQQFLLRNPLPAGKFRSGFGARRHPILGYVRMHTGVDWAAPIGTPIIAAGNGVIEKVGWAGGYGKQIIIRHANGYETSYNHQSAFAKGIEPGVHVRQGQTIGYLGQTGLATGPHLHYELIVNGTKVDPMRVRLPVGKVLKGEDLVAFKRERERIDDLLKQEDSDSLKVASAKIEG